MRCCRCHQDSIEIKSGHICCDICDLDIDVSFNLDDELSDLFLYNYELEEAEKRGRVDYINNKKLEDNPYSLEEIIKNKRWEEGYKIEEVIYEREAFSSSVEKLNKELSRIMDENVMIATNNSIYEDNYYRVIALFNEIKNKKYILGRTYRQKIEEIYSEIDKIKNPDS